MCRAAFCIFTFLFCAIFTAPDQARAQVYADGFESKNSEGMLWVSDATLLLKHIGDYGEPIYDGFHLIARYHAGEVGRSAAIQQVDYLKSEIDLINDRVNALYVDLQHRPPASGEQSRALMKRIQPLDLVVQRTILKSRAVLSSIENYIETGELELLQAAVSNAISFRSEAERFRREGIEIAYAIDDEKPLVTERINWVGIDLYNAVDTMMVFTLWEFDRDDLEEAVSHFSQLVNEHQDLIAEQIIVYDELEEYWNDINGADTGSTFYVADYERLNLWRNKRFIESSITFRQRSQTVYEAIRFLFRQPVIDLPKVSEKMKEIEAISDEAENAYRAVLMEALPD